MSKWFWILILALAMVVATANGFSLNKQVNDLCLRVQWHEAALL